MNKGAYLHNLADLELTRMVQEAVSKMADHVMTLENLAEYLKVHPSTVYRLLKKHAVPGFKIGRDWRFNVESIEKWRHDLEKNNAGPD